MVPKDNRLSNLKNSSPPTIYLYVSFETHRNKYFPYCLSTFLLQIQILLQVDEFFHDLQLVPFGINPILYTAAKLPTRALPYPITYHLKLQSLYIYLGYK